MAKRESKTKAVALRKTTAVGAWGGYKGPLGTEDIETKDITIPRLKIGQALSPLVQSKQFDEGSLYLNVTGQPVYTPDDEEGLQVIVVGRYKEYILWRPQKDGGGILARAKAVKDKKTGITRYAWDKPNQKFNVKVGGTTKVTWEIKKYVDENNIAEWGSEIPGDKESGIAATEHHNYVVILPGVGNTVAAFSLSRTAAKKARDLNAVLKMDVSAPIFAKVFRVKTIDERNQANQGYKNVSFSPDGYLEPGSDLAKMAESCAKGLDKFSFDQSDEDEAAGERNV